MIFFKKKSENLTKNSNIGAAGEDAAVNYIKNRGMKVLHRNWRCGQLEIDIIAKDKDTLVFIEVKTRKTQSITSPVEGISRHKRTSLLRAAKAYITANEAWEKPCRFDVAGVTYDANVPSAKLQVAYYDNAFDLSSDTPLCGGNSTWQPW